jgi:hypothetical protein
MIKNNIKHDNIIFILKNIIYGLFIINLLRMLYKTWKYGGVEKLYDTKYKYSTHKEPSDECDKSYDKSGPSDDGNG